MRRPEGAVLAIPLRPRWLALGGLLIAGLIAVVLINRAESKAKFAPVPLDPPAELKLVPADAVFMQHVKFGELMNNEIFKTLFDLVAVSEGKDGKRPSLGEREFGVKLEDIEALAMFGSERGHIVTITTKKPYDTKKILEARAPRAVEHSYRGKIFHTGEYPWDRYRDKPSDKFIKDERFLDKDGRFLDKRDGVKDGGFREFPKDAIKEKPFLPAKDELPGGRDTGRKPLPPLDGEFLAQVDKDVSVDKVKDRLFKEKDVADKDFFRDDGRDKDRRFPGNGPARLDPWKPAVYFLSERTYVVGTTQDVMRFIETAVKPDDRHPLYDAIAAAGKNHLTMGVSLPEEMAKEMRWRMRDSFRDGPFADMTWHTLRPLLLMKSLTVTGNLGEDSKLDVALTYGDNGSAVRAQDSARFALQMLKGGINYTERHIARALGGEAQLKDSKLSEMLGRLRDACNEAVVKVDGKTLQVSLKAKTDAETFKAVMAEIKPKLEIAAKRTVSQNNLHQLGIAMHMYHDNIGFIPTPGTMVDRQGRATGLSWRVHLLPYIDEAPLYRQFKLDEPWDSEANKKLIPMMPKIYAPVVGKAKEGMTHYQMVVSPMGAALRTAFPLEPNFRQRIHHIQDGTANTIAFVEAAEPVTWTKPEDVIFEAKEKMAGKFGGLFPDGFHVVFCDGSVTFLRKNGLTEEVLKAMLTAAGNEAYQRPDLLDVNDDDEDRPANRFRDKDKKDGFRPIDKDIRPIDKDFPRFDKDGPRFDKDRGRDDKGPPGKDLPKDDIKRDDKRPFDKDDIKRDDRPPRVDKDFPRDAEKREDKDGRFVDKKEK